MADRIIETVDVPPRPRSDHELRRHQDDENRDGVDDGVQAVLPEASCAGRLCGRTVLSNVRRSASFVRLELVGGFLQPHLVAPQSADVAQGRLLSDIGKADAVAQVVVQHKGRSPMKSASTT